MNSIAPGAVPLVDGHVHCYPSFSEKALLEGAFKNLSAHARRRGIGRFLPLLLLAEMEGTAWFADLAARTGARAGGDWIVRPTAESRSLLLLRSDGAALVIVAGRQPVTAEGLELLALATEGKVQGGEPLGASVEAARAVGGIPVIPWGAGKWRGRRGAVLRDYLLQEGREPFLFLGDNGGRPAITSPPLFRLATRLGVETLPGSDPLPLPGEEGKVGRRGFLLEEPLDVLRPADSLREILRLGETPLSHLGVGSPLLPFFRNQIRLRLRRRALGKGGGRR